MKSRLLLSSIRIMAIYGMSNLLLSSYAFGNNLNQNSGLLCVSYLKEMDARCGTSFRNGGNSFGFSPVLGTNDNYDLNFETNNLVHLSVKNDGKIGIGTTTPATKLEVAGQIKITGGAPGAGKVLTSDANGLATWETPASGGGGEANTASNIGTAGVGLYKQKTLTNLEFKNINATSSAITITDDPTDNEVDIGVNAELNGLSGLSANGFVKRTGAGAYSTASAIALGSDVAGLLPIANGGTGATTAGTALNNLLPSQATHAGKVLTTDGTNVSWAPATSGSVTSVTSANSYLSVSSTTTTPVITANVGTTSNTLAAGDDSRIINAVQQSSYTADLTAVASCEGNEKPYWNTITDAWDCTAITGFMTSFSGFTQDGNSFGSSAILGTNEAHPLHFETNGTNRMTVLANGDVGIGTSSPTSKLEVAGQIKITGGTPGAGKVLTSDANGLATWETPAAGGGTSSQWTTSGNDIYYSTGNVGLGTAAPTSQLDVDSQHTNASGTAYGMKVQPTINQSGTAGYTGFLVNTTETAAGSGAKRLMDIQKNGVSHFRVDANGSITALNNINGNWGVFSGSVLSGGYFESAYATYSAYTASSSTSAFPANSGGGVRIENYSWGDGNYTTHKLTVNNSSGRNQNAYIGAISTAGSSVYTPALVFGLQSGSSSYAETMRISASGYVGIGVTNPTTKLQVAGIISPALDATYNLGDSGLRFNNIYALNSVINTSDIREKTEVRESDLGLEFINQLNPVSYRWKNKKSPEVHYGLIAQDIKKVLANLKGTDQAIVTYDESSDRYGVRYGELISPLIKAVQELNQQSLADQKMIEELRAKNDQLEKRLQALEKAILNK